MTVVYNPRAFVLHAASLRQACAHCGRFSTAASRRSLGSVSVPVWRIILSDPLPVVALVGLYPTNKLIGRNHVHRWPAPKGPGLYQQHHAMPLDHPALAPVSRSYSSPVGSLVTCYSPVRRFTHSRRSFLARLACLIHAANVRSEPGSNPSIESCFLVGIPMLPKKQPNALSRSNTRLQGCQLMPEAHN